MLLIAFLAFWEVYVGILGLFLGICAAFLIGFFTNRWRMSASVGVCVSGVAFVAACLPHPGYTPELSRIWVMPELSLAFVWATFFQAACYIGVPAMVLGLLGTALRRLTGIAWGMTS